MIVFCNLLKAHASILIPNIYFLSDFVYCVKEKMISYTSNAL